MSTHLQKIPITYSELMNKSEPVIVYIHENPDMAVFLHLARFNVQPQKLYVGNNWIAIPINDITPEQFWKSMDNEV